MTIKHIVLLPFKPSLAKTKIEQIRQALSDLQPVIPEIKSFSWGENNSIENLHQGYMHGFVMEFDNAKDRKAYLEHPQHVKVAKEIIWPTLAEGASPVVFDYEAESKTT